MNRTRSTLGRRLALPLAASFILPLAFGQDADQEIYELSPFEVDASSDTGYRANSTLAGSRLNTELKDIAASVTVLTQEFMEDLGATDIDTALSYIAGAETVTTTDTQATASGGYLGGDIPDNNANPSNNRIRGLTSADVTMDFFTLSNPNLDSYNTERVTLVRGPNSVLFGLGSPAGIIDYTTKKASVNRNFNEVGFRIDNFGSERATIDVNRVIVDDKLAIRLMGLYEYGQFQFDSAFDRDRRISAALTYKPFEKTTIRVGAEDIKGKARRPRYLPPQDNISGWIAAGRSTWSAFDNPGANPGPAFSVIDGGMQNAPIQFFTDPNSTLPDFTMFAANVNNAGVVSNAERVGFFRSRNPNEDRAFYLDPQITDPNMFPVFDIDISALPGTYQLQDDKKATITLQQVITDDLQVELGYYSDENITDNFFHMIAQTNSISIDVNEKLPNGEVNPNFLRPFIQGRGVGRYNERRNEALRATVSYHLDFTEGDSLAWLGSHRFTGLVSDTSVENFHYAWQPLSLATSPAYGPAQDFANGQRRFTELWYVGPAFTSGMRYPAYSEFPQVARQFGEAFPVQYYDGADKTWKTTPTPIAFERVRAGNRALSRSESQGMGVALQSYFWNNRVVTTLGWRHDEVDGYSTGGPAADASGLWPLDLSQWSFGAPQTSEGDTMTKGAVFHATNWLSVHYNESENFNVSSPTVDVLGNPIPLSSGEGKDYGISVQLLENKLSAKINWYETAQINAPSGSLQFVAFWRIRGFEQGLYDLLATQGRLTEWRNWDGGTDRYERFNNVSDVNNYVADGVEIEVVYNPTSNWRIAWNASKQETVQSNTGIAIQEYIAMREPFWNAFWNEPWNTNQTVQQNYDINIANGLLSALALDGRKSIGQSAWSWNGVTNYTFNEGRLNGLSVGGNVRWRDKTALGYGIMSTPTGGIVTDYDNQFFGPSSLNIGVHAAYRTEIFDGKVTWKTQFNIQNLWGDNELVPNRINPDGAVASFRIGRETIYQWSNTFKF